MVNTETLLYERYKFHIHSGGWGGQKLKFTEQTTQLIDKTRSCNFSLEYYTKQNKKIKHEIDKIHKQNRHNLKELFFGRFWSTVYVYAHRTNIITEYQTKWSSSKKEMRHFVVKLHHFKFTLISHELNKRGPFDMNRKLDIRTHTHMRVEILKC